MTDNIKPLFPGRPTGTEPVEELVEILEDLLVRAKSGELQSLAFAGCCSDNTIMDGVIVFDDVFALMGAWRMVDDKLVRLVRANHG